MALLASGAAGQNAPDPPAPDEAASNDNSTDSMQMIPPGPMVGVHGVVRNAISGEPLPRALVQVDGETGPGALTDGDGKFDLNVAGPGQHVFQLTKPGYQDVPPSPSSSGAVLENVAGFTHSVFVAVNMPGLSFALMPTSAIHGHVDLSTGDPAQGIGVFLLRRLLQGGHASWQATSNARTNTDGDYRFAGLEEGDYAIATEPAMESDGPGMIFESSSSVKVAVNGYAAIYYPDAHEFSGAARIRLRGGETAQANLILKLEPFHLVRATLPPSKGGDKQPFGFGVAVLDVQGHALSYPARLDPDSRTVEAMLPDGTYALQATEVRRGQMRIASGHRGFEVNPPTLSGTTEFTVAGRPITNLRLPLTERVANPIVVNVTRNSARQVSTSASEGDVSIAVTQAGDTKVQGSWSQMAHGAVPGELEREPIPAGSYWVHTSLNQSGLCESSFTAGASNLGREPLTVGPSGTTAPLSLTLRDDCASLKLSLPPNLASSSAAEQPAFTVFAVPDFGSTVDVQAATLRVSSAGTFTLENLTPGSYHVYTFASPVELEYRNPEALAGLAGQSVTLDPSSTSTLVVEVPSQ